MTPPHPVAVVIDAPGKVNLALAVSPPEPAGAPRAGWHRICSLFTPVTLAGTVEVRPHADATRPGTFATAWAPDAPLPSAIDWPPEKDLCWRAWRALEAHTGRTLPCELVVRKRVPVGGGLGGGSSECAATLLALNRAFALGLSSADLRAIGQRLGSDVGYFLLAEPALGQGLAPGLAPGPALVEHFGDQLHALAGARPPRLLLLLNALACPTPAVYRAFDDVATPEAERFARVRALAQAWQSAEALRDVQLFNDLAAPALKVRPDLAELHRRCQRVLSRPVHVTGSGSTLFVLLGASENAAEVCSAASSIVGVVPVLSEPSGLGPEA
jgi:4-diphosphocytidyl-2-C-methyl-D-erythritol kinase